MLHAKLLRQFLIHSNLEGKQWTRYEYGWEGE